MPQSAPDDGTSVTLRNPSDLVQLTVCLALAIVFDTVQQLAWKIGIVALPDTDSPWDQVEAVLHEPLFGLVAILMLLRLVNWLRVLKLADLSYAQPITSISYVTVAATSAVYLKETLSPLQMAGVAVILIGVWCVSRTAPKSAPSEVPTP
jgi:drug/metabolite transporter (DMT)-like permease